MLKLGNTAINKLYLGNTEIKKAYLGDTLVYTSTPIDTGFIADYPLALNSNEIIGTTSGINGTDTDMVYDGTEATFNGSTSFISIPNNDIFQFTDGSLNDKPFTIEFEINPVAGATTQVVIDNYDSSNRGWRILLASNKIFTRLYSNGGTNKVDGISTELLLNGQNNTVKITYDGSNAKEGINITINGTLGTTYNGTTYAGMKKNTIPLSIGRDLALSFPLDGTMKNLKFYNYVK